MKKLALLTILLMASPTVFCEVIIPELPTSDIAGAEDHPLLKRYEGSFIVVHQQKRFDEFTFPTSKLVAISENYSLREYALEDSITAEGPYTRLVYLLPADRSPLEVIRNYQDEILAVGGQVVYECKRDECGGEAGYAIRSSKRLASLATILRPFERLGVEDYSQGYCAAIGEISDQRFLATEVPETGTYITVHTYTITGFSYTNCNAYIGRTVAVVDIVEGKPREKKMVTVEADDMAQQISQSGSVSLYGIFFDTDSASVTDDSERTLQEIAKLLQQQPDLNLLVVGHTDNAGTFEYNMNLSQNRAESVVNELSAIHGISPDRLKPVGVSFASPVSSNTTPQGQALNRRVDLVENRAQ